MVLSVNWNRLWEGGKKSVFRAEWSRGMLRFMFFYQVIERQWRWTGLSQYLARAVTRAPAVGNNALSDNNMLNHALKSLIGFQF